MFLVGLTETVNIIQRKSTVTNSTVSYSASGAETPRFRAVHEELINLDDGFGDKFNGILTDEKGRVRAFWASFSEQVACHTHQQFALAIRISSFLARTVEWVLFKSLQLWKYSLEQNVSICGIFRRFAHVYGQAIIGTICNYSLMCEFEVKS